MLGFLYSLFNIGAYGIGNFNRYCENQTERKNAIKNNKTYYIDSKGAMRDVNNNHLLSQMHDYKTNDLILYDMDSKKVIKNYDQEKRDKEKIIINKEFNVLKEQYNNNSSRSTYILCSDSPNFKNHGIRYKDKKTNAIYLIRLIHGLHYYVDMSNGLIIRPIDSEKDDFTMIKYNESKINELNNNIIPKMRKDDSTYIIGDYNKFTCVEEGD